MRNTSAIKGSRHLNWSTFVLAGYTSSLFLTASLLFSLQPLVGKILLPFLGGTPAVWNTCLVFYQVIYLAGCLTVFFLTRYFSERSQIYFAFVLLLFSFLFLPPDRLLNILQSVPSDENPGWWLIYHLLCTVGLPLFATSLLSPLLQHWFAKTKHARGEDPYFLSMASNAGSFSALFAYSFIAEPYFRIKEQAAIWTRGFGILSILVLFCALKVSSQSPSTIHLPSIQVRRRVQWLVLTFIPSSLLLGSTFYLSEVISVIPLLWILPLSLYLLSLILAFSSNALYHRNWARPLFAFLCIPWALTSYGTASALWIILPLHLGLFFLAALIAHDKFADLRPESPYLPEFYVWMAVGGALGGLFNSLLAPHLFTYALEYPLAIMAMNILFCRLDFSKTRRLYLLPLLASLLLLWRLFSFYDKPIFVERNFFGIVRVFEDGGNALHTLFHGATLQSVQKMDPENSKKAQANYSKESSLGEVLLQLQSQVTEPHVAVVGLGAGALATYVTPKSHWNFYEINPLIARIATDPKYFTFLKENNPENINILLGDARRELEKAEEGYYHLIVLDAFNSAATPVHLLTLEALALYKRKMVEGGVLAFNVSSKLFDLPSVLCRLAKESNLKCLGRFTDLNDASRSHKNLEWVFLARSEKDLRVLSQNFYPLLEITEGPVWTDDYSSLLGVVFFPRLLKARGYFKHVLF